MWAAWTRNFTAFSSINAHLNAYCQDDEEGGPTDLKQQDGFGKNCDALLAEAKAMFADHSKVVPENGVRIPSHPHPLFLIAATSSKRVENQGLPCSVCGPESLTPIQQAGFQCLENGCIFVCCYVCHAHVEFEAYKKGKT